MRTISMFLLAFLLVASGASALRYGSIHVDEDQDASDRWLDVHVNVRNDHGSKLDATTRVTILNTGDQKAATSSIKSGDVRSTAFMFDRDYQKGEHVVKITTTAKGQQPRTRYRFFYAD